MTPIRRRLLVSGAALFFGICVFAQETTPTSPTAPASGQTTPAPPASTNDPTLPTAAAPAGGTRMNTPDLMTPGMTSDSTTATGSNSAAMTAKSHKRSRRRKGAAAKPGTKLESITPR